MTLKDRIEADLKEAMKAREAGRARLSVLRLVKAAARNREIDKRAPLDEADYLDVFTKEVRQREEARADFVRSGRTELVEKLDHEVEILKGYLPEPLSDAELDAMVQEAIRSSGASGPGDMGRVMGLLMPRVKGRADGSAVRQKVQHRLGGS